MTQAALELPSPIAVTGASGYIASWIVKYLLDQGVTVRATVRDQSRADRVAHLRDAAANGDGTLELFDADLRAKGSFDDAVAGCKVVIHTASPFFIQRVRDGQEQLVGPALEGTRNVLEAVSRSASVERVVLTSSAAAICGDNVEIERAPNGVLDESCWNESSTLEHAPYPYSKTVAEREAWKIAEAQDSWRLITINPTFVLGPSLTRRTDATSVGFMIQMIDGTMRFGVPDLDLGVVDVRDVAVAHLRAAANPDAEGRHLLCAGTRSILDMARALRQTFGKRYPFARSVAPKPLLYILGPLNGLSWRYIRENVGIRMRYDNSKSREALGIEYRPTDDTLVEHLRQLEEMGLAPS